MLGRFTSRLAGRRRVGGGRRAVDAGRRADRPVAPAGARAGAAGVSRDGLPRARLERRRPARQPAGRGRRAAGARRRGARVVLGLRHRAGRRGARPARLPQRVRPHPHRARARRRCSTRARRSSASWAAGAGGVRHGPRPIDVDLLLLGDETFRSERLSLPHEQVTSRRFVLVPLLELAPGPRRARARGRGGRRARRARRRRRTCAAPGRRSRWTPARARHSLGRVRRPDLPGLDRRLAGRRGASALLRARRAAPPRDDVLRRLRARRLRDAGDAPAQAFADAASTATGSSSARSPRRRALDDAAARSTVVGVGRGRHRAARAG